ncbi:DUF2946 family protein [Azospirillum picis]|uniref:DUF2946 domain-containing protein n=1 Tax=Azospirillum picis TaxID=488438 RepID=A0ABU0MJT5_9PROT|nr:DUF2946 family protein [Azospirillum picis]MBP2299680.1 hypothetical protein [Azospirillum picis]MDQ0533476.1 hypothetical protein [Azospirillum picis]
MERLGSEQGGWRRLVLAVTACALIIQGFLFGAVGPKTLAWKADFQGVVHERAGHSAHDAGHPGHGGDRPGKPAGDQSHDTLCALICSLRAVASGPALLPAVTVPDAPAPALAQPLLPVSAIVLQARSMLPIGARGPPVRG